MSYIIELVIAATGFLAALAALLKEMNLWRTGRAEQKNTKKQMGGHHDFL